MKIHNPTEIEYFDVVDENDHVIGRLSRDEVHEKGLKHRAVHGLIMKRNGSRVLLQKRADTKQHEPGRWDTSISGHVSSGESYDTAIVRETKEEMDIDLEKPLHRLFKLGLFDGVDDEFVWVYIMFADQQVTPCQHEISQIKWLETEQFDNFISDENETCSVTLKAISNKMKSHKLTLQSLYQRFINEMGK